MSASSITTGSPGSGPRETLRSADLDATYALAVDLGTGGPKVGLVSLAGTLAWHAHAPVTTHRSDDGGATQDADEWWDAIVALTRDALASGVVRRAAVAAVSVTGQY